MKIKGAVAIAAAAALMTGCSGGDSTKIDEASAEWSKTDIAKQLRDQLGVPNAVKVTCDKGLAASKNAKTKCHMGSGANVDHMTAVVKPAGETGAMGVNFIDADGVNINDYPNENDSPGEGEENPVDDVTTERIKVGQPWEFYVASDETATSDQRLSVTITSVTCGEPIETDDEDTGEPVATKPERGHHFCVVRAMGKNTGDDPVESTPSTDGIVTTKGQRFAADDGTSYWTMGEDDEDAPGFGALIDSLNPGRTTDIVQVFQLPKDATPKELSFSSDLVTMALPKVAAR